MTGTEDSQPLATIGPHTVDVRPAVVLELCYAYYYLVRKERPSRLLPWHRDLKARSPRWLRRIADGGPAIGYEALILACAFGYDGDAQPNRFLTDLPTLPGRLLAEFDSIFDASHFEDGADPSQDQQNALRTAFRALEDGAAEELAGTLAELWAHLGPIWEGGGAALVQEAASSMVGSLQPGADLVDLLPAHHFVNLEESASDIRLHRARGPILVFPLYFATRGGFKLVLRGRLCIGYGVRSEDIYEEQKESVAALAQRLKAFSDPTRLLLLFQVARLARFPLTVGDLARQLNVSQPTASGHLKLLRDLELVQVVRRGNRSYYRLDREAARTLITELEQVLITAD